MSDSGLLFDAVKQTLERFGDRIVTSMREKLLAEGKLATGDLYNSIQYQVTVDGDIISLVIAANEYLQWVSDGIRPGGKQPPPANILKWIDIRGIRGRSYKIPSGKSRIPTNTQLAFLIGRSISIKGLKGTGIIEQSFEGVQDQILVDLSRTIAESITQLIGQEMQESADRAAQEFVNNNIQISIDYK